ncbi:MAG TPA: EpsI family protein [Pyrinomonadaceae bacterium]|nr:EpsI family protein [Pyrinomonadaceae bacterium]
MKGSTRFFCLLVVLLIGGAVVNAWQYVGEASIQRKELKDFPQEVGVWQQQGGDQQFDQQTLSVLGASDYLMRDYRGVGGVVANFYVGYYASQRDGATYHSPLNCLPGTGWVMSSPAQITIAPEGRAPFEANRYIVQNGTNKQLLVYWYQGRGRITPSEYWGKIYTVIDSVRLRRSDGAMVRVMVPVGASEATALEAATSLSASAAKALPEFIPN